MDCPRLDKQTVASFDSRFSLDCFLDYTGLGSSGQPLGVFAVVTAYSHIECINSCIGMNKKAKIYNRNETCRSITFHKDMRKMFRIYAGNCWLKTDTMGADQGGVMNENVLSAKLLI
jgi:hypothetical protein